MRKVLPLLTLIALVGCDRPPTRAEMDHLNSQVAYLTNRANELESKVSELESELEDAKRACEANACDCPVGTIHFNY
ncbi:hypothetical protein GETHED_16790 [Geothrix edaphica]|uniref:Uncharacterized protein n=1 Tax=Geothrix edaphica TaxID=2927976 RepID=A0ABQ5PXW9_9BACT|nr:hypothetical protein GETHED_16790 [Geothrix edaphica]